MIASMELRKRAKQHARQFSATAKRLADFLASVEAEETLRVQRMQDREARKVLALVGGNSSRFFSDSRRADDSDDAMERREQSSAKSSVTTLDPDQIEVYEEY